jgi:predicted dehydrogenase
MTGMRHRVAVVGAGAIGARHVQAMVRVRGPVDLDIVDPSAEARRRARRLLSEDGDLANGTVREFSGIDEADTAPDLAIIATTSRERLAAIREAVAKGARALILEKVLFTRLSEYDEAEDLFARAGVDAWVNCPRRGYPHAKRLADLIGDAGFSYRVEGQAWGLACNLVHHLDEFDYLSGGAATSLDTNELEPVVVSAKRPGFVEFFGHVTGAASAQRRFDAVCTEGEPRTRTVSIDCRDMRLTISPDQTLTVSQGGRTSTEAYPMPPQSQLTAAYVDAVAAGKSPTLPDYATAARMHRPMIAGFLAHMRRVRGDAFIEECPVT